jgi:enoyl-CoA hydratase/carnithine racemase
MKLPELTDALLTLDNKVATFTMNRHDVRNALTSTHLVDDIEQVIQWANTNVEVSVLVITGAGSAFSAGGNIKEMQNREGAFGGNVEEVQNHYRNGIQRIPLAIHNAEIPVIAAINGPAIGAGFDLANMCDLRIASTKAIMGETFINLGITPGDGGAWFLQRLIGYQKAAELTFTGRTIKADEALELGLVMTIVEPEQLLEKTNELANKIAAQPSTALRLTKRQMKLAQRLELKDFLDICACFQGMCHNNPQHLEAVEKVINNMKKR